MRGGGREEGGRACRPLPGKRKKVAGGKGRRGVERVKGVGKEREERKEKRKRKKGGRISGDDRFLVPRYSYARVPSYLRGPPYIYIFIRNLHDTPSTIVHSRASLVITTRRFSIHVVITTIMTIIISRSRNIARERNFSSPFLEFLGRSRTGEGGGECFSQI